MAESSFLTTPAGARLKSDEDASGIHVQRVSLDTALSSVVDSIDIPKLAAAATAGDALANQTTAPLLGLLLEWNGSSWQRRRGAEAVTVFASAARATGAVLNSADIVNYNGRGIVVFTDITAFTSGGLTIAIQAKDPLSLKYVTILQSAVLAAVGTTRMRVYPGLTPVANLAADDVLSRALRIVATPSDATSITYSVGAVVLP